MMSMPAARMKGKDTKTDMTTTVSSQEETELELEYLILSLSSSSSCKRMETTTSAGAADKTEPILLGAFSPPPHQQHERISPSSSAAAAAAAAADFDKDNDVLAPVKAGERQLQHRTDKQPLGFFMEFLTARGPPQITVLLVLLAFSFGSTVGVVPAVMSDRFARLNYGYGGGSDDDAQAPCYSYSDNNKTTDDDSSDSIINDDKPDACHAGYAAAQNALAAEMLVTHGLTFFSCSLIGALSDEYGRRVFLIFGIFIATLSPLTLLLIQVRPHMSPWWYYGLSGPLQGFVSWSTVALSSLTDAIPNAQHRAPSFGLAMAGVAIGFALGPCTVLYLGHFRVTILSLFMTCLALPFAIFYMPETQTPQAAARAKRMRQEQKQQQNHVTMEGILQENNNNKHMQWTWTYSCCSWYCLYRPLWELSILNRNPLFRRLSLVAFLCGIVSSGDKSLIVYYIQEHLAFTDGDIAKLFFVVGILGILSQACLLKILNDKLGERRVVLLALTLGAIHNALYGLAKTKRTIFVAAGIATIVSLAHPTLSAIFSNNVDAGEYGRIQGALASLQSLAAAFGPISLRCVYHFTKDGRGTTTTSTTGDAAFVLGGPGSMFLFAAGLYATAAGCSYFLPPVSPVHT
jgi:MFS transporter, DHA1 family, tetracycline resistance protein